MKADAEWESLTAKVEGREELYKGVEVIDWNYSLIELFIFH
jgi:hypothetical protein